MAIRRFATQTTTTRTTTVSVSPTYSGGSSTVSYRESIAIQSFLGYLQKNYSRAINPYDNYLIAGIAAWFRQESGGLSRVIGNNPFNIRPGMTSFMSNGYRVASGGNGRFLTFATIGKGFEAAAYLLMHANTAYGYRTAINALRAGGNQAAVNFLAAMAMSSWDAANYGTSNWAEAQNPAQNHLLRNYIAITGVQIGNPAPYGRDSSGKPRQAPTASAPKPPKPVPKLPRDFNFKPEPRAFIDPWLAGVRYNNRRARMTNVDGKTSNR